MTIQKFLSVRSLSGTRLLSVCVLSLMATGCVVPRAQCVQGHEDAWKKPPPDVVRVALVAGVLVRLPAAAPSASRG